jgi:2'-5' RNA ligase
MKYCIVTLIRGEIAEAYKRISSDVSVKFSVRNLSERIPCHITLKYPFDVDEQGLQKIEEKIARVIETKKTVDFHVDGFGEFDNMTIFFDIEENMNLVDALKSCVKELGVFDEDRKFSLDNYHPHISVVRYLTPQIFSEVWKYTTGANILSLAGVFDNISILCKEGDVWKVDKVFDFCK